MRPQHKLYNAIQKTNWSEATKQRKDTKRAVMLNSLGNIRYNTSTRTIEEINKNLNVVRDEMKKKEWDRYVQTKSNHFKQIHRDWAYESRIGGYWYGNVRYYEGLQYCEKFNTEFKERVRAFWGYRCFECGEIQTIKRLSVHHVHYDKKMCCNGSPRDVVPLCASCHTQTNTNRDYWEDHFTELLYANDPCGKCYFTKEEMKVWNLIAKELKVEPCCLAPTCESSCSPPIIDPTRGSCGKSCKECAN